MDAFQALEMLRPVRLYHWRAVIRARNHANACHREGKHGPAKKYEERLAIHMKHVQALNSFFPVGDTADNDLQRARAEEQG